MDNVMDRSIFNNTLMAALGAVAIATIVQPGTADARPDTKSFTCEGVRDYVADRGAVVMNTKNRNVYRRFVSNQSFCQYNEGLRLHFVPTRSKKSCSLKICVDISPYGKRFRRP